MLEISGMTIKTVIEQLPGYIVWKNMESVYLQTNTNTARLLGFKKPEELIGITDYDLRCKAADDADLFVEEDQKAQRSSMPLSLICISSYANEQMKALLANKSLFFDDNNKPLGTVAHAVELSPGILKDMHFLLEDHIKYRSPKRHFSSVYCLNTSYGEIKLSVRQAQCLFYVLRGKTNKHIAKILQLSNRTIESYLDTLKIKMNCSNKAELIEKSIDLGFLETVPSGIINHSFISGQSKVQPYDLPNKIDQALAITPNNF